MEKKTSSANRLVLKKILGQEGNNKCADCKTATHPRWASWNIGILICIRCSGIHRSLGTHISKVRSIDLDTWNDMQLEKLVLNGNLKANEYWESKLPSNYVPDESKIVNFIKTKYELKRWIPDDDNIRLASNAPKIPPKVRDLPTSSIDLLDLDAGFLGKPPHSQSSSGTGQFKPTASTPSLKSTSRPATTQPSLMRPSSAQSLPIQTPMSMSSTSSPSNSPTTTTQQSNSRADVKKSILSLYSAPSKPTSSTSSLNSFDSYNSSKAPSNTHPVLQKNTNSSDLYTTSSSTSTQNSATGSEPLVDEDNFASVWN